MKVDNGFVYLLYDPHTKSAYIGECGHDDPDRKLAGYLRSRGFRSRRRLTEWLATPGLEERLRIRVVADGIPVKSDRLMVERDLIKRFKASGWDLKNTVHA